MPNSFAYVMLLVWPVVAIVLFRVMTVERALIATILGGYLLLPQSTGFDFPLVPIFDKVSIPNLTAFLICVLMLGKRVRALPDSSVARILIVLFVLSPFLTVLNNREPILFDEGGIQGLRIYDSVAAIVNQSIFLLPFFLARQFLATEQAQKDILRMLMIAGLAYSVPMLIEVRLSPQLHTWIYGFFQHSFGQMIRQDGFRPIVFLEHGLSVAFFAMTTLIAATALWRTAKPERRAPFVLIAGYLAVVLVLCKSLAALSYAIFLAPLVRFASQRTQIRVALVLALIALLFPLLRGAGWVPTEAMVDLAAAVEEDRAASLLYRFQNEDVLLEHASEKPLFGWGMWGRNHVFDPGDGRMLTVTDGRWIIVIGVYGWLGYIVEFGLLTLPLLLLSRRVGRVPAADLSPCLGPLALMLAINMVDMLPNASLSPFTWLLAGALLGYVEALKPAMAGPAQSGSHLTSELDEPAYPRTIL